MNTPYIVLKSVLALAGLWVFIFYFWRDYRIDSFREQVFSIRDRLFLYAADSEFGFDSPAYKMLRNRMNVVLRYAHEFTMNRFLFFLIFRRSNRPSEVWNLDQAIEAVRSQREREKLQEFNLILAFAIFQFIVYQSFCLYLITRPIVGLSQMLLHVDYRQAMQNRPELAGSVERLESDAMEDAQREDCEAVGVA